MAKKNQEQLFERKENGVKSKMLVSGAEKIRRKKGIWRENKGK